MMRFADTTATEKPSVTVYAVNMQMQQSAIV